MKACDRHGRSEGSLKVGRYDFGVFDLEDLNEMGMPAKVFGQEFCPKCFTDFVEWSKTSPESLYLVEEEEDKPVAKAAKKGAK